MIHYLAGLYICAYLVFSMEAYGENTIEYQVIDDRLIQKKYHRKTGNTSMFGDFERQANKLLVVKKT